MGEDLRVILTPHAWKLCEPPAAIEITLETEQDGDKFHVARLVGRYVSATTSKDLVLIGRIRGALAESPGLSGSAVARRIHAGKDAVLKTLAAMEGAGEADSFTTGKTGSAVEWFLKDTTGSARFQQEVA